MISRRRFLATSMLSLIGGANAWASATSSVEKARALYAPAEEPVELALAALAAGQSREGPLAGAFGNGSSQGNVAITSLAALAFLAGGHHPGRSKYGAGVEGAVRYVLKQGQASGLLDNPETSLRGSMYNHGFATLLLAEAHGTIHDRDLARELRNKLKQAVQLLLETQNAEGGWRYQPTPAEQADLSVTAVQAMALRAARGAGIDIPKRVMERCAEFVKRCQVLPEGGFRYMPEGGAPTWSLTAAGLVGLHACGIDEGKEIDAGRKYLREFPPGPRMGASGNPDYFLYGQYYAAQALWRAGGEIWNRWYPAVRDELCRKDRAADSPFPARRTEGGWSDAKFGWHYATALCCFILQIPKNALPTLQN